MSDDNGRINRIVRTELRRVYGAEARQRIHRELHSIVCSVPTSERHRDWHFDLRRKRLQSWGATLRLIDLLVETGAPKETVLHVPDLLRAYALDQLESRDDEPNDRRAA